MGGAKRGTENFKSFLQFRNRGKPYFTKQERYLKSNTKMVKERLVCTRI